MELLKVIVMWALTAIFIFFSFGMLVSGSFLSALIFFLLSFLVIPLSASQDYIDQYLPRKWSKVLICFVLFFVGVFVSNPSKDNKTEQQSNDVAEVQRDDKIQEDAQLTLETIVEDDAHEETSDSSISTENRSEEKTDNPSEETELSNSNISLNNTENIYEQEEQKTYVLNTNSKKIHTPDCASVGKMKEKNKKVVQAADISDLLSQGYEPCSVCNPH